VNIKFLMKFLSIVLICNIFFCIQYLNSAEYTSTIISAEYLLGERLRKTIGGNEKRQNEQRTEKSEEEGKQIPLNEQKIKKPEKMVKNIPLNGSLKELMGLLSTASNEEKGAWFVKSARQNCLCGKGFQVCTALDLVDAARYYANCKGHRLFVKRLFDFVQKNGHYSDDCKQFVEDEREEILKN